MKPVIRFGGSFFFGSAGVNTLPVATLLVLERTYGIQRLTVA